jgi:hypothetical protein
MTLDALLATLRERGVTLPPMGGSSRYLGLAAVRGDRDEALREQRCIDGSAVAPHARATTASAGLEDVTYRMAPPLARSCPA